jgi:glycosyltransferase involved in cell wall biosynthesis
MRIIGLVTMRNEENALVSFLRALSQITDGIVVLDDCSSDNSAGLCNQYAQEMNILEVIQKKKWYRDEPSDRNLVLSRGRYYGGTHFICLDSDEVFSSNLVTDLKFKNVLNHLEKGDSLYLHWIQLWRSIANYRVDEGIWKENYKPFAFVDDGQCFYSSDFIHTSRVPSNLSGRKLKIEGPQHCVLHFQFSNWQRVVAKQCWYRYLEKVRYPNRDPALISAPYNASLSETGLLLEPALPEWFAGYSGIDWESFALDEHWRLDELRRWTQEFGVAYFSGLGHWE